MGSATELEIEDNQGSPPQTLSPPFSITFGPYALGTEVIFTATNTDDDACKLISPIQTSVTCSATCDEAQWSPIAVGSPEAQFVVQHSGFFGLKQDGKATLSKQETLSKSLDKNMRS